MISRHCLPRLAEIRDAGELRREILSGYRIIIPFAALGAGTIYLLRDFIITAAIHA